jgi:hypothetical protein
MDRPYRHPAPPRKEASANPEPQPEFAPVLSTFLAATGVWAAFGIAGFAYGPLVGYMGAAMPLYQGCCSIAALLGLSHARWRLRQLPTPRSRTVLRGAMVVCVLGQLLLLGNCLRSAAR